MQSELAGKPRTMMLDHMGLNYFCKLLLRYRQVFNETWAGATIINLRKEQSLRKVLGRRSIEIIQPVVRISACRKCPIQDYPS